MPNHDPAPPPEVFKVNDVLLSPPVQRAAYSDRTSWLMSALSELAYYRFEGGRPFDDLVRDLVAVSAAPGSGRDDIERLLSEFLKLQGQTEADNRKRFEAALKVAGFDLLNTYNRADTQAYLAIRRPKEDSTDLPLLALIFRGTEKKLADIKTDAKANLITPDGATAEEKVHAGFYAAFQSVRAEIEADLRDYPGIPLYIAGHSLGGALAVIATRLIASDSVGACYTFGGPRTGNLRFAETMKTPVYRVVNAADAVPRVPPAFVIPVLIGILERIPLPFDWLIEFLKLFRGYVHYGDMRYLTHVDSGPDDLYPGLVLHSNPSIPLRAHWWIRRMLRTMGRAGYEDHSISRYRRKLAAYGIKRNSRKDA